MSPTNINRISAILALLLAALLAGTSPAAASDRIAEAIFKLDAAQAAALLASELPQVGEAEDHDQLDSEDDAAPPCLRPLTAELAGFVGVADAASSGPARRHHAFRARAPPRI